MDLSSIEQIIRTQVPNAQDSEVELYLNSVKRDMKFGADYSDMSEDDIVEDFEFFFQSKMDEVKKPSTKMTRRELKEMIKAAFLSEADFTNAQDDDAALGGMYDPVYEAEEKEETAEEILARITGTKVDPYLAEAKDEEEEMDITVDAEEETTDGGEGKLANDSIVVDKKIVSLSSLPQQTRKILDSLETLRAQAEEFGDQKFITQVGNTITFFTRDFVVAGDEPTKAKVDESLEILKMKKLAGLLKEGEYAKALLRESKKDITKEMLSSEEQETINYILGDNIEEVEMGTAQFDTLDNSFYQEVLSRLKRIAKKGLLTAAVLSTVLGALPAEAHSQIKDIASIEAGIEMDQVSNPATSFTKTQNKDIIKQIKSEFPGYVRTGNLGNGGASLNWGNVGGDRSAKVGLSVSYEPGNDFIQITVLGDTQSPSQSSPAFQNVMNKAKELTFKGGSIDKSESQASATIKVPTEKLPEVITFLKSTVNNLK